MVVESVFKQFIGEPSLRQVVHSKMNQDIDGPFLFCNMVETIFGDNFLRDVAKFESNILQSW